MVSEEHGQPLLVPEVTADDPETSGGLDGRPVGKVLQPWRIGLLSVGFGALGAALMLVDDGGSRGSRSYTGTPQFKIWVTIIIAIVASLPTVWRVGTDLLRRLGLNPRLVFRRHAAPVLALAVLIVAGTTLAGIYARGSDAAPVNYGLVRVEIVYAVSVIAAVPAFLTQWESYGILDRVDGRDDVYIGRMLGIRECLLSALATIGLLVSAGILAAGAERQAALADAKYTAPFPAAYVLIWGVAFSSLLLVVFLPPFRRLIHHANLTIDDILPILPPRAAGWQSRLQERKDLAELLKVTGSLRDVIISAVLVAGPLISSLVSLLLPSGSR
ncbi:MAG TPA: hypothetical protein VK823_07020 [Streptosporangiaceae bacterium]|jgi:hypothetical protein|nr:hypothetical protein [Streptosporangiaceae bacterium]HTA03970.1 hypothetical protein [Streptosporangiaceae bacterium]